MNFGGTRHRKRRLLTAVLVAAVVCLTGACPALAAALTIVLPAQPAAPEQFAGAELAKYLAAMGNPAPRVRSAPEQGDLYVGVLPADISAADREAVSSIGGQQRDSFVLRSAGTKLIIYGNSPRANLYGAYQYLESLGARWYFPGAENEVIPQARARLDGFDVRQVPSFRKRGIVIFSTTPGFRDLVDFAAKRKLNTIGLHTLPSLPAFTDAGQGEATKVLAPRGMDLDIERHFFGETFCPDDSVTLDREKSNLLKYVATLPPAMTDFFLWAADKYLPACTSPRYRHYATSDSILWFSNEMAAALRQTRPEARFAFLSYLGTEAAPVHEKPAPGVFLEWAPIRQCFAHAIDDPACPTNGQYREKFQGLLKIFRASESQVLGYWLDDTLFSRTSYGRLPYAPDVLQRELRYYHAAGVRAVTTFGVISGRDYFAAHTSPAAFLYPELLWNINSEPRALVHSFCRDYFGSDRAAEIFELLAEADRLVYVDRSKVQAGKINDPEFIAKLSKALDLAQSLLRDQSTASQRARAAKLLQEISSRFSRPG